MRAPTLFAVLVAVQALHSAEEYVYRLYADFPLAAFVSGLFSSDPRRGFLLANVLIVTFGLACLAGPVRRGGPNARRVMWGWAIVEAINGIGHPLRSLMARRYTAGSLTAAGLLVVALLLARRLAKDWRPE
jgi:hypothetical protein